MNAKLLIEFQANRVEAAIAACLSAGEFELALSEKLPISEAISFDSGSVIAFYDAVAAADKTLKIPTELLNQIVHLGNTVIAMLPGAKLNELMAALDAIAGHELPPSCNNILGSNFPDYIEHHDNYFSEDTWLLNSEPLDLELRVFGGDILAKVDAFPLE